MKYLFLRMVLVATVWCGYVVSASAALVPADLRCERLTAPRGVDEVTPQLSWRLEADKGELNKAQTAYCVLAASSTALLARDQGDLWDSGKIASAECLNVPYAGKPLVSGQPVFWKVRVWDEKDKATAWSATASWMMGKLKPEDWTAKWIAHPAGNAALAGAQWIWTAEGNPASGAAPGVRHFRRSVVLPANRKVVQAMVVATADNAFELSVNGTRAAQGDNWEKPVTADIAALLRTGENLLTVRATNGGDLPNPAGLLLKLRIAFDSGAPLDVMTDAAWEAGADGQTWTAAKALGACGMAPWAMPGQAAGAFPHPWLRKSFELAGPVRRAEVYVNTPGLYELYINGQKAGDDVLAPSYSHFPKRIFYTVHDVSGLLRPGTNSIALWLAPGWHQPCYGNNYGSPIVRVQLEIETATGRSVIGTDASWRSSESCITQVGKWGWNNMGGECWDAAKFADGWNRPGFDDSAWGNVREVEPPPAVTTWLGMPPNRMLSPIKPARIYPVNGKWVIDFGTTLTGWMRLKLAGLKPRQQIVMDYADLDKPKLEHMPGPEGFQTFNQQDLYSAGEKPEDLFCSKFNQHAFRYVVISGLSRAPTVEEAVALPIMTDLEPAGSFACSNELFNRIHDITVATYKTQTPNGVLGAGESREKEGYGDGGAFLTGFLYNFRSDAYFRKWIDDWCDTQRADGFIAHTAPRHVNHGGGPPWGGQAGELVRRLCLYHGDRLAVAETYPKLKRYVDYLESKTKDDVLRYFNPYGPKENTWSFLGDWVSPVASENQHGFVFETRDEQEFFNNCYRVILWQQLADFAEILGDQAEARRCRDRLAVIRPLVHKTWFDPEKKIYRCRRQAYPVVALLARIMPEEMRPMILKQLEDAIAAKNGHLDTGMLGTSMMLELLAREGRNDLAATMMAQTTYPGWGFLIETRGVTTWPETWTGWGSQIILVTGTPGAWFYEGLAGIRPDPARPGFKNVIIKPAVVQDVTWVKAHHDGPYGRIAVEWKKTADGKFTLELTIPPNSTATVTLPDGSTREAGSGDHQWSIPLPDGRK